MIDFEWPFIFLLAPIPLYFYRKHHRQPHKAIPIPTLLLESLHDLPTRTSFLGTSALPWLWLAWFLLLAAIAQPWTPGDSLIQPATGRAIALAIDTSGSMERKDLSYDNIELSRLDAVKQIASAFIENRKGDRISLVLYGKEAFIASPLSFDLTSVAALLNSAGIGMAGRSTAIGDALGLSIKTLTPDPATSKAIILLSDGTNNAGTVEPESAAELATSLGIRIHTIALGSINTKTSGYQLAPSADLDEASLEAIAAAANGSFFRATSLSELDAIYQAIDKLEQATVDAPPVIIKQDLTHWPLYAMLFIFMIVAAKKYQWSQ